MKRRKFITGIVAATILLKVKIEESLFQSGVSINDKEIDIKDNTINLPPNPIPFNDVITVKVSDFEDYKILASSSNKIMSKTGNFKIDKSGTYTIQFTGQDIGWLIV